MPSRSPYGETGGYIPPQTAPPPRTEPPASPKRDTNRWHAPSLSRESSSMPPADRSGRPIISEPPRLSLTLRRNEIVPRAPGAVHGPGTRPEFLHLHPRIHVLAGLEGPYFCSRFYPRRALGSPLTHSIGSTDPQIPQRQPCSAIHDKQFRTRCRRLWRMFSWTRVPADLPTLASHRCSASPDGGCAACCSDEDHESMTEGHKGMIMILLGISRTLSLYKDYHVPPSTPQS